MVNPVGIFRYTKKTSMLENDCGVIRNGIRKVTG